MKSGCKLQHRLKMSYNTGEHMIELPEKKDTKTKKDTTKY